VLQPDSTGWAARQRICWNWQKNFGRAALACSGGEELPWIGQNRSEFFGPEHFDLPELPPDPALTESGSP